MLGSLPLLSLCLRRTVLRHKGKLLLAWLKWFGCGKARHFSLCHRLKTDNPVPCQIRASSSNPGGVKSDHHSPTVLEYVKVLLPSYTFLGTGGNFRSIQSCNSLDKRVRVPLPKTITSLLT